MTRNKEPEKAKFHGQNSLYVKFGNKGGGGGGGELFKGSMGMDNPPTPPPHSWKDLTNDCSGSILITLQNLAYNGWQFFSAITYTVQEPGVSSSVL